MGSIVVALATDAPLLPHQCARLAQRASIGIARTGGGTEDSSGDIFIAFATGNDGLPPADYANKGDFTTPLRMVNNDYISALFAAAAEPGSSFSIANTVMSVFLPAITSMFCSLPVSFVAPMMSSTSSHTWNARPMSRPASASLRAWIGSPLAIKAP